MSNRPPSSPRSFGLCRRVIVDPATVSPGQAGSCGLVHPRISRSVLVLSMVAGMSCRPTAPGTVQSGGALAIVGPGVISTDAPEFAVTLAPDGSELYFNRATPDRSRLTIMVSYRQGNGWSAPAVAPFSGLYRDVDPFLSADGRRLYFSSDRPRPTSSVLSFSTWYVDRVAGGWSAPIDPGPPLNSDSSDVFVTVARSGDLVFGSTRDGPAGIYLSRFVAGRWETPRAVVVPSALAPGNPLISPSGRHLVFAQRVPGQNADLFVSCRRGDQWSAPIALSGLVNSSRSDFAPALDAAEATFFFTSERPGISGVVADSVRPPGDLYQVAWASVAPAC